MREVGNGRAPASLRVGHLLRVTGYLEVATISMWTGSPSTGATLGMVQACVRDEGPCGADEELLGRCRSLIAEARDYHADGDFAAAMARVRVAQDLVDLRIVAVVGG